MACMNEFELKVYEALKEKFFPDEQWLVLPQLKTNTGYANAPGGERYIDFFIINFYPSNNYKFIAIEVKSCISDFRKDIKDMTKQIVARFYSDEFYYLIPEDVYKKNKREITTTIYRECSREIGLYLIKEDGSLVLEFRPKLIPKSPLSFGFTCSLIRRAYKLENGNGRE